MVIAFSAITISAANQADKNNQQNNKISEQAYYKWEELYQICINEYDSCIKDATIDDGKKLKKLKMSEVEYNSYKDLCSKLKSSIVQLKTASDFNTPIDFDINKWDSLSCKFREVIKSNIKDELGDDNYKTWEKKCSALKDYYSKLSENYKNAKHAYAESLIKNDINQKTKISQLEAQNDSLTKKLEAQDKKQDPCNLWYDYQEKQILSKLRNTLSEYETETLLGITKTDINALSTLSNKVKENYEKMQRGEKVNDNNITIWKQKSDEIYNKIYNNALKYKKWTKTYNITKETAMLWNNHYTSFYNAYTNLSKKKSPQTSSHNGASEQNYERLSSSNLLTENKKLKSAATQAFEVCLFYPLAVKYNKEYVDYAYDAAKKLIDAEIHTETLAMKNDWYKYSPLLKNYGLYNTNVINYINWCKSVITKYKGNISTNDITYFKDKLKFYYDLYKTNVTITYLDNVIDEFYSMLEKNVSKNKNIEPNAIDNFIRIYLK